MKICIKNQIPSEFTLQKGYVNNIYNDTIDKIRGKCSNKTIWVSINETTNAEGIYIENVIVGAFDKNCAGNIFLLNSDELHKTNHSTICKMFDSSMNILWTAGIQHDNVPLFLSDTATYMV